MIKSSIKHLAQNNMSYYEHLIFAFSHGVLCLLAGIYLICHSILPAVFQKAGSNLVKKLNKSFTDHLDDNSTAS